MDQHFLKITYHPSGSKKMNAYLKMPSPTYHVLKKEIEMCLFDERKQPRCEIRTFWIDEDQDEIEIINQCDYDIFMSKRSERQHLQVAATGVATEEVDATTTNQQGAAASSANASTNQSKIPPAAGSYEFAVHDNVECDACLMAPIMGFRYKCIQCPNFDLCQNCEAKHIHSEHMMVRMPTNNCPNVVEAYVTGRTSGRRHGKRSKTTSGGCPYVVKNGISVVIDDEAETAEAESGEQTSASPAAAGKERHHGRKHRRHHRNNFLSNLYEMMHDLAEGGGAAAAAAATGASTSSSSTSTDPNNTTTTTTSTTNSTGFENLSNNVNATAAAAHITAQKAHETAVKAAEIAAKVAHETAIQAAKNMAENHAAPSTAKAAEQGNEQTKEKADANTSARADFQSQPNQIPVSPSLETIAQFLDPQYMKTGIQILNNFSDMFAKMLDPMDGAEGGDATCPFAANLRKNSTASSTRSSVSSNRNSMGSDKQSEKITEKTTEKSTEKTTEKQPENKETKQPESDVLSNVEIDDLGSDSENDSVSESFIKLDAPKEPNTNISTPSSTSPAVSATPAASAQNTPPPSLNKSITMDFAQFSADLKAHIAEEAVKDSTATPIEAAKVATEQLLAEEISAAATPNITSTTTTAATEPVVTTTTTTSTSTNSNTTTAPNKPEEKRAVPVYHTDQRINNSVLAMMSMGFSNEGAWLTQLLESVNGNISEALDLMSVAQRSGH